MIGSKTCSRHCCIILSYIIVIPSSRFFPFGLEISTRLTDGGFYSGNFVLATLFVKRIKVINKTTIFHIANWMWCWYVFHSAYSFRTSVFILSYSILWNILSLLPSYYYHAFRWAYYSSFQRKLVLNNTRFQHPNDFFPAFTFWCSLWTCKFPMLSHWTVVHIYDSYLNVSYTLYHNNICACKIHFCTSRS